MGADAGRALPSGTFEPGAADRIELPFALLDELAAAHSLTGVIKAFSRRLVRSVGAERASIALFGDDTSHFELVGLDGETAIPIGSKIPVRGTMVGRALDACETIITDDLAQTTALEAPKLVEAGLRSTVNVPILSAGRCLGAVNFAHSQTGYFNRVDLTEVEILVKLLASHVAVHDQATRHQRLHSVDELTGVLSRRAILETLRREIDRSGDRGVGTLYLDLDGFKLINDTYGHAAGDRLLQRVAERFQAVLRPGDTVGRLGGDEFLVVVEGGTRPDVLLRVAERLHRTTVAPIDLGLYTVQIEASIGAAITSGDGTTAGEMLVEADLAMYHAKQTGQAIVVADEHIARQADRVATIDRELEEALDRGDLCYHYQPIRGLQSMEILGLEALMRWQHPVHGFIPPPLIVERVEMLGLLPKFTEWTLRTAAVDLLEIRRHVTAFADKATSVNLTAAQLGWSGYLDLHAETVDRHRLRPVDLIVEVVESGLVEVGNAAEQTLRSLGERGSVIALDDFGTGHNVLGYFAQFPVHAIKFDRSLIEAMVSNDRVRALIRGLSQVAGELGVYTLAEGIEGQEQVEISKQLGIIKGQGYHLGRPMPLETLIGMAQQEFPEGAPRRPGAGLIVG